jgi:hypothetical protein
VAIEREPRATTSGSSARLARTVLQILLLQPGDPVGLVGNRHVPRPGGTRRSRRPASAKPAIHAFRAGAGADQLIYRRFAPRPSRDKTDVFMLKDAILLLFIQGPSTRCAVSVALIDAIDATPLIPSVQIPIAHRRCRLHQHVPAVSSLGAACATPALKPRRHGVLSHEGQESDNP